MEAYLVLYNQVNKSFFAEQTIKKFFYIHNTSQPKIGNTLVNFNIKSKLLDYACGYNFMQELEGEGYETHFQVSKNYYEAILTYAKKENITNIGVLIPCEPFLAERFKYIKKKLEEHSITLSLIENHAGFLMSHKEYQKKFPKPPVMETFYRYMRKKFDILMEKDGTKPIGGQWNFDKENRKFEKNHTQTHIFQVQENEGIKKAKAFYQSQENIEFPSKREEALDMLKYFIKNHLDTFGKLEDAMYSQDPFVHHSLLSTPINFGLLEPHEVIYAIHESDTALNNKEGYIRQILGWREYMFHFFHFYKDDIYEKNYFHFTSNLSGYFWDTTKKSGLNCLDTCIKRVFKNSYGHHIERLMIIGNFCLLTGKNPLEVNRWFFEKYTDAFEWVVTPNVMGMSQYSDGGRLATKPYIASGNYINKMSDFCKSCQYDVKTKYETNSCPFNFLYWAFIDEHKETFQKVRQSFILKNLERIDREKIQELKERFLENRYQTNP